MSVAPGLVEWIVDPDRTGGFLNGATAIYARRCSAGCTIGSGAG